MKVTVLTPLGSSHQETGVIALAANYLRSIFPEVSQLVCNGAFSLCDRDIESGWSRALDHCHRCAIDQHSVAAWGNLTSLPLSSFMSPQEIWDSKRWISSLTPETLLKVDYRGLNLYQLCLGTVSSRFGVSEIDIANKNQLQFLQRLLLASLRMCIATHNFWNRFAPDLVLLPGGQDFITRSFLKQSQKDKKPVAFFRWEVATRSIRVYSPYSEESFVCDFVLEDVTSMRSECNTWPAELLQSLQSLLAFLEIPEGQLKLPLAR